MSTVEKGTGFELKIARLFKQNGYCVTHNIKMKGRSGTEHQIDVLAEYKAPLHMSTVIIETKSHQNNINKDIIMKLIHIREDLSADRAILVSTSSFTSGAISTAGQYKNIELWDGEMAARHLESIPADDDGQNSDTVTAKTVPFKLSTDKIRSISEESAQKRSRGGFLGRGRVRERVTDVKRLLYPYYTLDVEVRLRRTEKTGWFSKEESVRTVSGSVSADAVNGSLVDIGYEGAISYRYSYLRNLDDDELQLLRYVSKADKFEKRNLSALGWSAIKIGKIVNGLCGQGILKQTKPRPATYQWVLEFPQDPSQFQSILKKHTIVETPSEETIVRPKFSPERAIEAFVHYWPGCDVKSITLVYYPYYAIVHSREDGSKVTRVIDGVSGERQEYLDDVVLFPSP